MTDKKCPRCGLWSTESAMQCDCGYVFDVIKKTGNDFEQIKLLQKIVNAQIEQNQLLTGMNRMLIYISLWLLFILLIIVYYATQPSIRINPLIFGQP